MQIHFVHYKNFTITKQKWIERSHRVDLVNIFIFMELGIETSQYNVSRFENLPFKNKIAIINTPFIQSKSALFLNIYQDYKWGKLIRRIPNTLKRYIDLFDYINWFNKGEIKYAKFNKKYLQSHPL